MRVTAQLFASIEGTKLNVLENAAFTYKLLLYITSPLLYKFSEWQGCN